MSLNPQAIELNDAIKAANPNVFEMLSERGKRIYFPKRGILAQAAEANGKGINATIGTALEDDGQLMILKSLMAQLSGVPASSFGYAPSPGRPEFRKMWGDMLTKKNPSLKGAAVSVPVVTSALTHGLSMAGYLFANEGDTVIVPDLYWENYDLVFDLAYGAKIETYPTFKGNGYNVEGLRAALNAGQPGKKIVVLNFPNNPTGYTVTEAEAKQICDILVECAEKGNRVVALIDDAYFGLVFEKGIFTESLFAYLANAHERILAVKLDGPTKEDYVWGFRVGFATFGCAKNDAKLYAALEGKLAGAIRGNISNVNNLGQTMLLAAYSHAGYDAEKQEKFDILQARYRKIKKILAAHPEYAEVFTALPFNSGYFMCVQFSKDAEPVRQLLLSKFSVGTIAFGKVMRIAFSATPLEKLESLFSSVYQAGKEA
jgi:aspartate/methionine/tyrosine aminotransferase